MNEVTSLLQENKRIKSAKYVSNHKTFLPVQFVNRQ